MISFARATQKWRTHCISKILELFTRQILVTFVLVTSNLITINFTPISFLNGDKLNKVCC